MKHDHRVNTPTSSPWFAANQQRRLHLYMNAHMLTHSNKQPGMHKPPASIFHYYNTVSWRQGWGRVTLQLCARWAVIDTRPQTWVVTKRYRKDPAGSRKGAVGDVTDAGTQLRPLYTHIVAHSLKHKTACGTGLVLSDVTVILLGTSNKTITLRRMNLPFRCSLTERTVGVSLCHATAHIGVRHSLPNRATEERGHDT